MLLALGADGLVAVLTAEGGLSPADLARASASCRALRAAASNPAAWRVAARGRGWPSVATADDPHAAVDGRISLRGPFWERRAAAAAPPAVPPPPALPRDTDLQCVCVEEEADLSYWTGLATACETHGASDGWRRVYVQMPYVSFAVVTVRAANVELSGLPGGAKTVLHGGGITVSPGTRALRLMGIRFECAINISGPRQHQHAIREVLLEDCEFASEVVISEVVRPRVLSCRFEGGLTLLGVSQPLVHGCTFTGSHNVNLTVGVERVRRDLVRGGEEWAFSRDAIEDTYVAGFPEAVWRERDATLIEGNELSGASSHGLVLRSQAPAIVRGNTLRENGAHGLAVVGDEHAPTVLLGNTVVENGLSGVFLQRASAWLADNVVSRNKRSGLVLSLDSSALAVRNTLTLNTNCGAYVQHHSELSIGEHNVFAGNAVKNVHLEEQPRQDWAAAVPV